MPHARFVATVVTLAFVAVAAACQTTPEVVYTEPAVEPASLGDTDRVHACGDTLLASQPSAEDFDLLAERGYRSVLNLRSHREDPGFNEAEEVARRDLLYHQVGFGGPDELTDDVFRDVRHVLNDDRNHPIFVHCASANRVGAVWLAHRVLDDGMSYENALAEARTVGLRSDALESRARDYIFRERDERDAPVN